MQEQSLVSCVQLWQQHSGTLGLWAQLSSVVLQLSDNSSVVVPDLKWVYSHTRPKLWICTRSMDIWNRYFGSSARYHTSAQFSDILLNPRQILLASVLVLLFSYSSLAYTVSINSYWDLLRTVGADLWSLHFMQQLDLLFMLLHLNWGLLKYLKCGRFFMCKHLPVISHLSSSNFLHWLQAVKYAIDCFKSFRQMNWNSKRDIL